VTIAWQAHTRGIEVAEANSAAEFIEALRPSNRHWWDGDRDEASSWVFRGHAQAEWPLLPTAWRPNKVIASAAREAARRFDVVKPSQTLSWFPSNFITAPGDFEQLELTKPLTIATTAEYIPIWDFARRCDELGMNVPLAGTAPDPIQHPNWLPTPEYPLSGDELLRFTDFPEALALAQHHGIPTRLLDWTRNPMAAAFFAVEPLRKPEPKARLVVWALHKRHAGEVHVEGVKFPYGNDTVGVNPAIMVFRPPTRNNPFLAAQAGLFTTITGSGIYYMKKGGKRPSLEGFVAEAKPASTVLRQISLSHEHAADLIEILRKENVSRSALMPTTDNVARDVLTMWEQQQDLG